jgi:hypothetical protein
MRFPWIPAVAALFLSAASLVAAPFAEPVKLTTSSVASAPRVALAYSNDHVLALWSHQGKVRVKAAGLNVEHVIAESATGAAIASVGARAVAVWTDGSGSVWSRRLASDGTPAGLAVKIGDKAAGPVTVAANATRYLVAWDSPQEHIYSTLLDSTGAVLLPPLAITDTGADVGEPVASSNGVGFAVVWHTWPPAERVYAALYDGNGIPESFHPMLVGERALYPDITSNGEGYFVAWGDRDFQGIRGRSISATGDLGRRVTITSDNGVVPRLAWDGSAYSMAYVVTAYPRPGYTIPYLASRRFRESGGFVEGLGASAPLFAQGYDLKARAGRVDLLVPTGEGLTLQTATVATPPLRSRAVRR